MGTGCIAAGRSTGIFYWRGIFGVGLGLSIEGVFISFIGPSLTTPAVYSA